MMENGDVVFTVEMDGQPGEIRIGCNGHALEISTSMDTLFILPEASNTVWITLSSVQMDFKVRPERYRDLIEE
mgnify:CR=1 FL=1